MLAKLIFGSSPRQAAALPWRRGASGDLEILLVTGLRSGRLTPPKGHLMKGKTIAEAAAVEAFEEAGVEGIIDKDPVGTFEHIKSYPVVGPVRYRVVVHPLEVRRVLSEWPEQGLRDRRWFAPEEAAALVRSDELANLLRGFAPPVVT